MAKPTPNPVKCIGNQILVDGRLQFQFAKGQETTAIIPSSSTKVVIPVALVMIVPDANKADYVVGNSYDLLIQSSGNEAIPNPPNTP
jgi:hypothetical protein